MSYRFTGQARAWIDESADLVLKPRPFQAEREFGHSLTSRRRTSRCRVIWATRAWQGKLGRYVAIRLDGELLMVGIAAPERFRWISASVALTNQEAEAWAATGFTFGSVG